MKLAGKLTDEQLAKLIWKEATGTRLGRIKNLTASISKDDMATWCAKFIRKGRHFILAYSMTSEDVVILTDIKEIEKYEYEKLS